LGHQGNGSLPQLIGIHCLIGETSPPITQETTKTAFASDMAVNKHHPAGSSGIPLDAPGIHIPSGKQSREGVSDRVGAEAAHESREGSKPGQATGHVGWSASKPVFAR
jgi:hypothetical protein